MRQPREHQFDPHNPPWLHCISRCVRRAYLCGDGYEHRKAWIEERLALLARHCAVQVGAYAIMSNHLHVVLRPRPQAVDTLSDDQVLRAWWALRENEDLDADPARALDPAVRGVLEAQAKDTAFLTRWRARLGSVSWFMKAVKEPLSRMANREDDCTGAFWEGRFRSVPLLDTQAIVTCMAYVDLNPIRAQLAATPESSEFTSIKARIAVRRQATRGRGRGPRAVANDSSDGSNTPLSPSPAATSSLEHPWLTPVSTITSSQPGDPGWTLDEYLRLVDGVGRYCRAGKAGAIPADLSEIIQRLDADIRPGDWFAGMLKSRSLGGSALGALSALAQEAKRRGRQWLQARCRFLAGRERDSVTTNR